MFWRLFRSIRSDALALNPFAGKSGPVDDNLVLKSLVELRRRIPGLKGGRFRLEKNLPVAAGIGGGSADAAAALRLLAIANRIALDDSRLMAAAQAVGADVPVCMDSRPRVMQPTSAERPVGHAIAPARPTACQR